MKLVTKFSATFFLMFIIFTGCSDDFDLNADYNRQPVVYGILDTDGEDQIIMINHTFLGSGSAFDYAQFEDSSLYNNVEARIFWNEGSSVNSVELKDTIIDTKDIDGLFYAPEQTVYTAKTADFNFADNSDEVYSIGVMADGDTIFANTNLVNFGDFDVSLPSAFTQTTLVTSASDPFTNPNYSIMPVLFTTVENAIKHKVGIRITYTEQRNDGTSTLKTNEYDIQNFDASGEAGGEEQSFPYSGEAFYQTIGNRIQEDASVDFRRFEKFEVVFYSFGSDLSRYIDIINPTGGVGQESPSYSNINNGEGRGIFSARSSYVREITISSKSLQELIHGQYTNNLGFCHPDVLNCE